MVRKSSTDPVLSGFVLAGGKSLRMGRDKATLGWKHHTLLDHIVQLLSTVADPVRIVGREDLPDRLPGCGPLGGILTALEATTTAMNLIVAVDLPLLTPPFLLWFCTRLAATSSPVIACRIGNRFPLCLGIHRSMSAQIAGRIETHDLAIQQFIRESLAETVSEEEIHAAGFPDTIFHNVNTPDDWQQMSQ